MGYYDEYARAIKRGDLKLVSETSKCTSCHGTGQVPKYYWYSIVGNKTCPTCNGKGQNTYSVYRPR